MLKKVSVKKAKKTPAVKHVHYIYVILSVIVLSLLITIVVLPMRTSHVLGVMIAREAGNARGGDVDINKVQSDPSLRIDIQNKHGREVEQDGAGKKIGKKEKNALRDAKQRIKKRMLERLDRDASDSGDDLFVASESGERIHVQKNRKEKILVLPEKAVAALLKNGIIQEIASSSGSASSSGAPVVVFTRVNGTPVYIVAGSKEEKLFGAIPVHLDTTVTVSAETGDVVSKKESFLTRVLDLFSF